MNEPGVPRKEKIRIAAAAIRYWFLNPTEGRVILLPASPALIIWIPIIISAIPIRIPANSTPKIGATKIIIEITISRTPTPILNPLDQPACCLSTKPLMILAIPSNRSANPKINITKKVKPTGKASAILAIIIVSTPNPTVAHLDLCSMKIPAIIFSMPTKMKTMASTITNDTKKIPGNTIAAPETMIARMPKPICAALIQPGDLLELIC